MQEAAATVLSSSSPFLPAGEGRREAGNALIEGADAAQRATRSIFSVDGGEGENLPPSPPKKRALFFAAFVACITFLYIITSMFVQLVSEIINNERVWNAIELTQARNNRSLQSILNETVFPMLAAMNNASTEIH